MTVKNEFNFTGVITAVSASGTESFARLDNPVEGFSLACIGFGTKGRMALMSNSPDGKLVKGTRVEMSGVKSVDAFDVRHVRLCN